jgi:hypothetical protein
MQRQYQICSPKLPNGMAWTFAEEVLRALQDPLSVYQNIRPQYALGTPGTGFCEGVSCAWTSFAAYMAPIRFGCVRLAWMVAMVDACYMACFILARRWTMADLTPFKF